MDSVQKIKISDYNYDLPENKIAKYPLKNRDQSRLLCFRNKLISEDRFINIAKYLPDESIMFFNETRVIQARLLFRKPTGAKIEIFCLEPSKSDIHQAFQKNKESIWKCFIGNVRRWKEGTLTKTVITGEQRIVLHARLIKREKNSFGVHFFWHPEGLTFADIIEVFGLVPLPPYLNREPVDEDKLTYQTVYAKHNGSVAAPTAGLHFTPVVFKSLENKHIDIEKLILHVGAGTFKPVISESIEHHEMHFEKVIISRQSILNLIKNIHKPVIAVGTTSVRTLESLYWFAVKLKLHPGFSNDLHVDQWDPYQEEYQDVLTTSAALEYLDNWMQKNKLDNLQGSTQLMIAPGYKYKIVKGMVTNFHQPKSTLLLLVSAFVGNEWRNIYKYALDKNFRFLSYGDACLFLK